MMSAATTRSCRRFSGSCGSGRAWTPSRSASTGIAHAVRKRIAASGADSPQDYLHRLLLDPAEFQELLEDLVVPETWFFRDALAFRRLAALPRRRRSSGRRTVRVLSVACSTGEEVYSLAMALREAGLEPSQFQHPGNRREPTVA